MSTEILTPKIVDNTFYSIGFPNEFSEDMVNRDNYILQIEDLLARGFEIVFIEGDEDAGKTTLCAQFARSTGDDTVTVFFNPLNILDYQIEFYCTNVVSQIKNILKQAPETIEQDEFICFEEYQRWIFQLRRMRKKNGAKLNLVIDGLEGTPKEKTEFLKQLFAILPFGHNIFRIIITGNESEYISLNRKLIGEPTKSINVNGFTLSDTIDYLGLEDYTRAEIKDLYKITRGLPGRLRTLKRLISYDKDNIDRISKSTNYKSWIELDCESVDLQPSINNAIISLLALRPKAFYLDELASICSKDANEIDKIIGEFQVVDVTATGSVSFVSREHKRYFANKLRGKEKQIEQLLIDHYASDGSANSLIEYPKILANRQEWSKIIDVLDQQYLPKILDSTGSLNVVNESLEIGIRASEKIKKYSDLWRYSIQGAIVNELDNYLFWESEIEARISIHDFTGAISLAQSAVLKVDRFRLLALIARRQKELDNKVDEDLVSLVQDLYKSTDILTLGEKIYDIVADLIYAIPNLAIEMIEKSSGNASEDNINDWIVAKLSIAAIDSNLKEEDSAKETKKLEALENLNSSQVKKIKRAISFLVGNYSSDKVLEEVNKLKDSKERLRLLRLWLSNNRRKIKDIEKVIEAALNELIQESKTSGTIDVLKELSYQLPYVEDRKHKENLLKRFKTIENDLPDLGLTKSKYIYQLNIFHTRYTLDESSSIQVINQVIKEIEGLDDLLIKLECFAEVYSKLNILRHPDLGPKIKFAHSRLLSLSEELFRTTASHFKISKNVVSTIAKRNPILAIRICDQINTRSRRERAKHLALDAYLNNNLKHVKVRILKLVEKTMELKESQQDLVIKVLERYAEAKSLHFKTIRELTYYTKLADEIQDPTERIYGQILSYKIVCKNSEWRNRLANKLESQLYRTWNQIEADWESIDIGFKMCSELSKLNEEFAKKMFGESENKKSGSWLDSRLVAYTYLNSLKLIVRAYNALLVSDEYKKNDYQVIEGLIARVPSEVERVQLWTEVGLNAYLAKKDDVGKKVLDDHVIPLMQQLLKSKMGLNSVLRCLTFVHLYNSELTAEFLIKVSVDSREEVLANICHFYVTRRSPFEVYEEVVTRFDTTYSDLTKAVYVLKDIKTDSFLYYEIKHMCEAIAAKKNKLSQAQISDLTNKLEEIVITNLPDSNNIKHDGYKILANAKIKALKKHVEHNVVWPNLIEEANKIDNLSDKVFIKAILLEDIPFEKLNGGDELKSKMYDEVIESLNSFNTHYEYVQRVIDLTDIMHPISRKKWQIVVNNAFSVSSELESGSEVYISQKNIIDSMYRLDPDFAKNLMSTVIKSDDKDRIAELLQDHMRSLEISNKIKNDLSLEENEKKNYQNVVKGIYLALKALNSDRIITKKLPVISSYLAVGNKLPLHEVFPIYWYYLNNCIRTHKSVQKGSTIASLHKDNFEQAIEASKLIELLSYKRKASEKSYKKFFIDKDFETNEAIKPGTREEALLFIRDWIKEQVSEYIIIADPYFKKEDLDLLKYVMELDDEIEINILGSREGPNSETEQEFKKYWKKISAENPPFTNLTFCWMPDDGNETPFHDRWILTKGGGLRSGTSLNSIGVKKESELSIMKPSEALEVQENILMEYINSRKRTLNNARVSYNSFSL